jgi:hypothetical protein
MTLSDLAGQQKGGGAEQLELLAIDGTDAEEAVHVVDGQREDLFFAPLFVADLRRSEDISWVLVS